MPGLTVLNESRRIACGAPDYIIARRGGCRQYATIYKRILAIQRTSRLVAEAQLAS